jgi:hypothetical protein
MYQAKNAAFVAVDKVFSRWPKLHFDARVLGKLESTIATAFNNNQPRAQKKKKKKKKMKNSFFFFFFFFFQKHFDGNSLVDLGNAILWRSLILIRHSSLRKHLEEPNQEHAVANLVDDVLDGTAFGGVEFLIAPT